MLHLNEINVLLKINSFLDDLASSRSPNRPILSSVSWLNIN